MAAATTTNLEVPALVRRHGTHEHALPDTTILERLVLGGDLSKLDAGQRLLHYQAVCESLRLNPLTQPFQYVALSGKLVLYATRNATDQLRALHGVSIRIVGRERQDDLYVVTAQATMPDGRCDESTGAVPIGGLRGEALGNAVMRAETKSKRRVTLSIVGLGMVDESELGSIPGARMVRVDQATGEIVSPTMPALTDDVPTTYGGTRTGTDDTEDEPVIDQDPKPLPTAAQVRKLEAMAAALRIKVPNPRSESEAVDLIESMTQRLQERQAAGAPGNDRTGYRGSQQSQQLEAVGNERY